MNLPANTDRRTPSPRLTPRAKRTFCISWPRILGYFVARQFLGFYRRLTGASARRCFGTNCSPSELARTYRFAQGGTAYHLFSRKVYRQIGRENLRNRRDHEFEYVRARIAILDFVLGNLDHQYLETEPDKVAYFCSELAFPHTICLRKPTAAAILLGQRFAISWTAIRCSFPQDAVNVSDRDLHLHSKCGGKPCGIRSPFAHVFAAVS